jgi:hypothetical protein
MRDTSDRFFPLPSLATYGGYVEQICEVHLVDDLKAKMLIGVDIIGPEQVDILVHSRKAHIASCGVDVPINVRPRRNQPIRAPVQAQDDVVVPPNSEMAIPVNFAIETIVTYCSNPKTQVYRRQEK